MLQTHVLQNLEWTVEIQVRLSKDFAHNHMWSRSHGNERTISGPKYEGNQKTKSWNTSMRTWTRKKSTESYRSGKKTKPQLNFLELRRILQVIRSPAPEYSVRQFSMDVRCCALEAINVIAAWEHLPVRKNLQDSSSWSCTKPQFR